MCEKISPVTETANTSLLLEQISVFVKFLAVGVFGVFCEDWGELEALRSGRVGSGGKLGCLRLITKWMFEISTDLCTFSSFR